MRITLKIGDKIVPIPDDLKKYAETDLQKLLGAFHELREELAGQQFKIRFDDETTGLYVEIGNYI